MARRDWGFSWVLLLALGCAGGAGGEEDIFEPAEPGPTSTGTGIVPGPAPTEQPLEPGTAVTLQAPTLLANQTAALSAALGEVDGLTTNELLTRHDVTEIDTLGYDPTTAAGLDLIQASAVALYPSELDALAARGFVISARQSFPTFTYGYQTIYMADLPLYVSADSILDALHRSYDDILQSLELSLLIPELRSWLSDLRAQLPTADVPNDARADIDFFVSVALGLLDGEAAAPVAGGDAALIRQFTALALEASGMQRATLFGVARDFDFSQFTPRGHYTDSIELEQYFRAMMWLGRIDFRLIETQPDHTQVFHRRQFDAMLALRSLMNATSVERHVGIDRVIEAFVGESDYMTVGEIDPLLADLGVATASGAAALDDARIAQAIIDGGYGAQRISSHIMVNGLGTGTMPLSRSFAVFGQRYVVDSHVFSNLVYDRVQGGAVLRMMPDPLDVAFAALGNDQAAPLLAPELDQYSYAPDLESMRLLVDAHGADYWQENLYTAWLGALRALSPERDLSDPGALGLPRVVGTEAWGRRMLNSQLASWAQLRHDTILYAKQSYTGVPVCEFPDAYVDPYPAFYQAVVRFAELGDGIVAIAQRSSTVGFADRVAEYFGHVTSVATMLGEMAEHQRQGIPFTAEHMEFINRAVSVTSGGCVPDGSTGWYADLFFYNGASIEADPTIADVHTQPADEGGSTVGRVLHVGTGPARLFVVTADTCNGPRAYAGLASSYHEKITENFQRLDDERWSQELYTAPPPEVDWMSDIVAR